MTPAQIPVFLSQKPSTENGQFCVVTLILAWLKYNARGHLPKSFSGLKPNNACAPTNRTLCYMMLVYAHSILAATRVLDVLGIRMLEFLSEAPFCTRFLLHVIGTHGCLDVVCSSGERSYFTVIAVVAGLWLKLCWRGRARFNRRCIGHRLLRHGWGRRGS